MSHFELVLSHFGTCRSRKALKMGNFVNTNTFFMYGLCELCLPPTPTPLGSGFWCPFKLPMCSGKCH